MPSRVCSVTSAIPAIADRPTVAPFSRDWPCLQAFIPKLLGRTHVTAYATGNIGVAAAADLARHVQSLLSEQLKTRPPFPSQVQQVYLSIHLLHSVNSTCVGERWFGLQSETRPA